MPSSPPPENATPTTAAVSDIGMINVFAEMVDPAHQNVEQVNTMRAKAVLAAAQGPATVPVPTSPQNTDVDDEDDYHRRHSRYTSNSSDSEEDTRVSSHNAAAEVLAAASKPIPRHRYHDSYYEDEYSSGQSSRTNSRSNSRNSTQPPQPQTQQQQQPQTQQPQQPQTQPQQPQTQQPQTQQQQREPRRRRVRRTRTQGFRDALEAMLANYRNPAGNTGPGSLKVARQFVCDPDEAERRDVLMQLDEFRLSTGMAIEFSRDAQTADLTYVLQRYTEMLSRNNDITLVIDAIQRIAQLVESVNTSLGPYLPLHGYSAHVNRVTQRPEFRYAVYRMLLKYRGPASFSPVREIALALLMPVFTAIVTAAINYVRRGNATVDGVAAQMQDAAQSVATFVVGSNPPPHIPSNVPDAVFADGARPVPPAVFARGGADLMTMPGRDDDDDEIDRQLDALHNDNNMTGGNSDDDYGIDVVAPVN